MVIEQPAAYDVGAMLGLSQASHGSVDWKPERGTRLHVLDRSSGEVETRTVPAFFFFHIANAFDDAKHPVPVDVEAPTKFGDEYVHEPSACEERAAVFVCIIVPRGMALLAIALSVARNLRPTRRDPRLAAL